MSEVKMLQEELAQLPPEQQERWAGWFRQELAALRQHDDWYDSLTPAQLVELRAMVQEGIDSGDAGPLDIDDVKREARAEWETREQRS